MDFTRLTEHVIDVIKEEQVKLGYRKERIRLYYPLDSLNQLLGGSFDILEMHEQLKNFDREAAWGAGQVEVWNEEERFCLSFSPEVAEYVHTHTPDSGFLYDLVDAVSRHGTSLEEVLAVFHRYSECVRCEKMNTSADEPAQTAITRKLHGDDDRQEKMDTDDPVPVQGGMAQKQHGDGNPGEMEDPGFDYLVWFEDGSPDSYRYCIREELGHVIYHRYTEEDYRRLSVEANPGRALFS